MKIKYLLTVILLIVSAGFSAAQNGVRVQASVDGKCGFIDQNGKWVISPQYDEINDYIYDDMIQVKVNGKWGLIDTNGNLLVSIQYDEINHYAIDDMIQVKDNDKWGFVSISNKTVITPQYEETSCFGIDGTAPVKLNGKWRLIDKTGKTVRETQIEEIENGGYYVSLYRAMSNGKWGYIDYKFNFVIEPQYEEVGCFYNNRAFVKTNGKYGYIDTLGKMVIEPKFEEPGDFPCNWAVVKFNGKFGFINPNGEFVIEPKYDGIKGFLGRDSSAIIVKLNGKYGFIDKIGKTIVEPQYDEVDHFPEPGIAIVSQNDKYWVIDKSGTLLTKPLSGIPLIDSFLDYSSHGDGDVNVWRASHYGLVAVRKKNKFGYIDSTGNVVIKPKFDYASDFYDNDFAEIQYKGQYGWINKKTYECHYIPKCKGVLISHNIIFVMENDKWGIVDENGNFIVEPKFDWVVSKFSCLLF